MTRTELKTAVLCVVENEGCAGVDGVTVEAFAEDASDNLTALQERLEAELVNCYAVPYDSLDD